jgi:hypothetical protein
MTDGEPRGYRGFPDFHAWADFDRRAGREERDAGDNWIGTYSIPEPEIDRPLRPDGRPYHCNQV